MNTRERFLEVMDFNPNVAPPRWEMGYWGATINRWYREGLPRVHQPIVPTKISTTTSSLYTTAWTHQWRNDQNLFELVYGERENPLPLPEGIGVLARGLYWPTQGFPEDQDVAEYFAFDKKTVIVHVEQLFHPLFEPAVINEDEKYVDYIDIDGVTRRYQKKEGVIPAGMAWPITDRKSWETIQEERLRLDAIGERFPENWWQLLTRYKERDYPLALGGYPVGIFGTLAHLLGYEKLFLGYYEQPELIKDIIGHFTDLWISLWEEVLSQVDIDVVHIWEDMSFGKGSMVSPAVFKEFMTPYYQRITDFVKSKGVSTILVDTDGDCRELIPLFLEAGVTGLYPFENIGGMTVKEVRKNYPTLQILGGVSKHGIAKGPEKTDQLLSDVEELLDHGGYIPHGDHGISPDVSWDNFTDYRTKLNRLLDARERR